MSEAWLPSDGAVVVPLQEIGTALGRAGPGFALAVDKVGGKVVAAFLYPIERFEAEGLTPAPAAAAPTKPRGMLVTLITDASHHNDTRSGGWAAWGKSQRGTAEGSGPIKHRFDSTSTAELFAVVNGVHMLFAQGIAKPGDHILAQIDNIATISLIDQMKSRQRFQDHALHRQALGILKDLLHRNNATIQTRHIKAHVGTEQPRHWAHDRCDQLSRSAARRLRAELLLTKQEAYERG